MTTGIYGIFDAKTEECLYVGQASNIEYRWKQHLKELRNKRHKRKDFVEWYHENGISPSLLEFRILEECENDNLLKNNLEIKWFRLLMPKYFGKKPSVKDTWEHNKLTKEKISHSLRSKNKSRVKIESNYDLVLEMAKNPLVNKSEAAKELGVSFGLLHNFIKENEIEWVKPKVKRKQISVHPRKKRILDGMESEILGWYFDDKLSTYKIGEKLGVSAQTVMNKLHEFKKTDIRFSEIHERKRRTTSKKTKEQIDNCRRAQQKRVKSSGRGLCRYCSKEFSRVGLGKHEDSCKLWPKCKNCNNRLTRRDSSCCYSCATYK